MDQMDGDDYPHQVACLDNICLLPTRDTDKDMYQVEGECTS